MTEALTIFRKVVETLAYVHAKGIRHCDLKPGNILMDARGRPRVADFGQAHLSDDASPSLGTFFYMAPEQADLTQQVADMQLDVHGLGALFYAMVTGEPPRKDPKVRDELATPSNSLIVCSVIATGWPSPRRPATITVSRAWTAIWRTLSTAV